MMPSTLYIGVTIRNRKGRRLQGAEAFRPQDLKGVASISSGLYTMGPPLLY